MDSTTDCNRRLSRAARSVLLEKTFVILSHHFKNRNGNLMIQEGDDADAHKIGWFPRAGKNVDELLFRSDKMKWYKDALSSSMKQPSQCILNMDSSLDIFWDIDHFNIYHGIQYSKVKRRHVYTCTICQRKFSSMFYLDMHFQNHHVDVLVQDSKRAGRKLICPAQDLCRLLGGSTCHLEALKNEPYYSRGDLFEITNTLHKDIHASAGVHRIGPISEQENKLAKVVRRSYEREIMGLPCDDQELEQSRLYCLEAMEDCFGGDDAEENKQDPLLQDMKNILCQPKTCQDYLGDILNHGRIKDSKNFAHLIQHEWDEHLLHFHQNDMRIGVGFIISLFLLSLYVGLIGGYNCFSKGITIWFMKRRRRTFDHNLQTNVKKLD